MDQQPLSDESPIRVTPSQIRPLPPANWRVYALLALLGSLFAGATLALGIWRYQTYRSAWPFDLAFFNHQLWNLRHGMAPLTLRPVNYYAIEGPEPWRMAQMRLVSIPLALLYGFWPGVPFLLTAQSVACGLGVWPMYRMAARRAQSPAYGLLAAGAYVLCVPLWLLVTTDFRPITLAVPFVLMAIDALDARSARRYLVWSLLALSSRHVVAVILAASACGLTFRRGEARGTKLRWIIGPLSLSAAWMGLFLLFLALVHGPESVGKYYRGMRNPEAVGSRIEHPVRNTLAYEWPGIVKYQLPLLVAGLGAPELAVVGVALNYPPLRMGQWSLRPSQHFVRYTAPSSILLLAALAITVGRIGARRQAANRNLRFAAVTFVGGWLALSTAGLIVEGLRLPSRFSRSDRELLEHTLSQIEPSDTVLAFFNVLPPLSNRSGLYTYEQLPGLRPNAPLSLEAFDRAWAESDWCLIERIRPLLEQRIKKSGQFQRVAVGERFVVFRRLTAPGST